MSQSSMRGMRLGTQSLESEHNVSFEARSVHSYLCPQGHISELKFSATAEIPETWECKHCARSAVLLIDGVPVEPVDKDEKAPRSHWEMLLERRTIPELEELLDEQLANLRARRESARLATEATKASA
jgi:RNA polymerase-binding protein